MIWREYGRQLKEVKGYKDSDLIFSVPVESIPQPAQQNQVWVSRIL